MISLFEPPLEYSSHHSYPGEPSRDFWDRIGGSFGYECRRFADQCLSHLPLAKAKIIRGDWRSGDDAHLSSAWWELFLHESLLRAGWDVTIPAEKHGEPTPDFLVRGPGQPFYVEAYRRGVTPSASTKRAQRVFRALSEIRSPNHALIVSDVVTPDQDAPLKLLKRTVETWLMSLREGMSTGTVVMESKGVVIRARAWPRPKPNDDGDTIAAYPASTMIYHGPSRIKEALAKKRTRYRLDHPLVIAFAAEWPDLNLEDTWQGLFGSYSLLVPHEPEEAATWMRRDDGMWWDGTSFLDTHLGGLVVGHSPQLYNAATVRTDWWWHPGGGLSECPPVGTWGLVTPDGTNRVPPPRPVLEPHELLGLRVDWPGPVPWH